VLRLSSVTPLPAALRLAGKGYLVIGLMTQPPLGQRPEEVEALEGTYHTHGMKGAKLWEKQNPVLTVFDPGGLI
jgi:hypothetical protein